MAVGMIRTCEKCGGSWDDGRTKFHFCSDDGLARVQAEKDWPNHTLAEKVEILKKRLDELERNQYRGEMRF